MGNSTVMYKKQRDCNFNGNLVKNNTVGGEVNYVFCST